MSLKLDDHASTRNDERQSYTRAARQVIGIEVILTYSGHQEIKYRSMAKFIIAKLTPKADK
jgi:hypothetical protein